MTKGDGSKYKRNIYILSLAFFCVFTAFSTIQNLEGSVVGGHCSDCVQFCWDGNPECKDANVDSVFSNSKAVCSWTDPAGVKYCAKFGGACKSDCPNNDGGYYFNVSNKTGSYGQPEFDTCSASSNVGAIAIGILYATFTLCCLIGPFVVDYLGSKWSVVSAFVIFSVFCVANVLVASDPGSTGLQWGLLVPSSAAVGFAASFLWTAQGAYVATNAERYAHANGLEKKAAMGSFMGIFWGFFQATQIAGNLAASLLLDKANWSTTALMLFYLCFAGVGTGVALFIGSVKPVKVGDCEESDGAESDAESEPKERKSFRESLSGMIDIIQDKRMVLLIPIMMYNGFEQGFAWGDFTSNWVKPGVGLANIGYVMAAFGAADVIGSITFGKLSDRIGRFPVMTMGVLFQGSILALLKNVAVENCDKKYSVLIISACCWGFGDACWNTQLSCILAEVFGSRKEDAFSNLKLWQSLMTSAVFFLNFDASLLSKDTTLYLLMGLLGFSYLCYTFAHFKYDLQKAADEEGHHLLNDDVSSVTSVCR
eukprot:TRINITY_DN18965_c0_g1_i1.p1 TRINITY_DN18965_c0_g1~~TRINITY_DN18965_c0_g1_i1.p1  ORF type:complete len:538 (+),score=92.90 TRINITY_DN18965_c0_g1_i1:78-1691(+)